MAETNIVGEVEQKIISLVDEVFNKYRNETSLNSDD